MENTPAVVYGVVFGHSVAKNPTTGEIVASGLLQPANRISDGFVQRTFLYNPDLKADDDNAYLGGAQPVVEAAAVWFLDESERGNTLKMVFIGGRPPRFNEVVPDESVTESAIMARDFLELVPNASVRTIGGTRTTKDDMVELLKVAQSKDCARVVVIAMGFRIPRAHEFMRQLASSSPDFTDAVSKISFVSAEQYLPELRDEVEKIKNSPAFTATLKDELFGFQKLFFLQRKP